MKSVIYAGILLFLLSSKLTFSVLNLLSSSSVFVFFFLFSLDEFKLAKFVFSRLLVYFFSLDSDLQFYISQFPTFDKFAYLKAIVILLISPKSVSKSWKTVDDGNLILESSSHFVLFSLFKVRSFLISIHFVMQSKFSLSF